MKNIVDVDIYVALLIVALSALIWSLFFNSNESKTWIKKYHELLQQSSPLVQLITPPKAFVKHKRFAGTKHFFRRLLRIRTVQSSAYLNDYWIDIPPMKGRIDIRYIPSTLTPLVCFVNSKSGGKQGEHTIQRLK